MKDAGISAKKREMLQQVKNSVRNVAFKNNKQQVCLTRD
jgi:hypothetical protein